MKSYAIRMNDDLLEKLRYVATYEGCSANSYVIHLIRDMVAAFEEKHGPIPADPQEK